MYDTRSCYEFMKKYKDPHVNCITCVHSRVCEERREREFDKFDREMKSNKGVWLE